MVLMHKSRSKKPKTIEKKKEKGKGLLILWYTCVYVCVHEGNKLNDIFVCVCGCVVKELMINW